MDRKLLLLCLLGTALLGESSTELYSRTQHALAAGDLAGAEVAVREILARAPNDPGAHGNLAVVYMRRQQWDAAMRELRTTERLAPNVAGVRLNIALIYYHENRFSEAIEPLESVLRDQPGNPQATYLLGLCDVFAERYSAALPLLEQIWDAHSDDLAYLYVMAAAADDAHHPELEQKAIAQMMWVGEDSAEVHLYIGKAYLSRQQDESAQKEFELAAEKNPKLPVVHYFLGAVARRLGDPARAREEFLKDIRIEPDLALDYDQLGTISQALGQLPEAEKYFRQAVRLDANLASSHFGLAKALRERKDWKDALMEIDAAERLAPDSASIHYVRAQILRGAGREAEWKKESMIAAHIQASERDRLQDLVSGKSTVDPNPPALR